MAQSDYKTIILAVSIGLIGLYLVYQSYNSGGSKKKVCDVALTEKEYRKFKLIKKTNVSHNTRLFRFALQTADTILGLPCGKHISFRFIDEKNDEVRRSYTPVTSDDEKGYFDMVIKVYNNGKMSKHLDSLNIGDSIEARGPMGVIHYDNIGHFSILKKKDDKDPTKSIYNSISVKKIGMIAGGTGITPMMQIIRAITKNKQDKTQVNLIFGNISIDDILLRDEIDQITQQNQNISVYYTLDKPPEGWKQGAGYITPDMIKAQLPEPANDTLILACGPPIMVKLCVEHCVKLGYNSDLVLKF